MKKAKSRKKYNHSFARRMTLWVMLVLFVMMCALAYFIYELAKGIVVDENASTFHSSMKTSGSNISDVMSDVEVAVRNNVFDVERSLGQPDQLPEIMRRIVEQNPWVRSCGVSFVENYYSQKGRSYCPYAREETSENLPDNSKPKAVASVVVDDYLAADWFQEAVAADSAYWSKPFFDNTDGKTPLVAYMHPIHDQQGKLVAVLGADLSLDFMTHLLQKQDSLFHDDMWAIQMSGEGVFNSFVLSRDGTYITHPDQRRILKGNFYVHVKDADEPGLAEEAIDRMKNGLRSESETDKTLRVNWTKSYLFFMPLEGTDWNLVVAAPMQALDLIGIIAGYMMLLMMIVMLVVTFFVSQLAIGQVAKPLKQLAASADQMAGGRFDAVLPAMKSHDEIHLLRDSFENMQHSLTSYVEELKRTTAAKASMESELKIAHNIQMAMLPKTFPAYPERQDVDIYGQVMPAKAVGGDLYDFFIRDEKLFFYIGDVSGKGVPASLFMAVTCSLMHNISSYTQDADQIMQALNNAISSRNDTVMFVTFFLGVLDLKSGSLSYANGGHNPPLLLTGDDAEELSCDANVPVGVMEGWEFTVQQLQLKPGDTLFLYTDGLNEAEDCDYQQFGMDRIKATIRQVCNDKTSQQGVDSQMLVSAMTDAVKRFAGDAEQSDDLTMLAIGYNGNENDNDNQTTTGQ